MGAPNEGRNATDAIYALAESMAEMKVLLRSIANTNAALLASWQNASTAAAAAESEAQPQQQQVAAPPPPPPQSKMDTLLIGLIAPQLGLDPATLKGMSEEDVMTLAIAKMGTKKPVEAPANPPPSTPPPATS